MNTDFLQFFTDRLQRLPSHLRRVATLPCQIWKSNIFAF